MENFIVSARKYRPSTFLQVVGQGSITATLKNAIVTGHLAQAFLFTGPRGVGKTTCARILAKTINCLNPASDGEPCNECESCRAFNDNASFNIHELDAASNNSVDDIRALVEQVRIPPQAGKYKVYIIDEVHMLSSAAFNAFLKTLEEPPSYAKFILATTEKHKIIPTILSRCQIFDFKRINVSDIAGHLAYVAKSENIEADEEALMVIAQKVDGALRDALSTFDQIVSYSGQQITYRNVIENLNILDYEYYFKVTDALLQSDIATILLIFDEILQNGFDGQDFLDGLTDHLRNILVMKNPRTAPLLETSHTLKTRYQEQSDGCSNTFLFKALDTCNQFDLSYKNSNNKRLHVEIALTQLCSLNQGIPEAQGSGTSETKPVYHQMAAPAPVLKQPVKAVAKPASVTEKTELQQEKKEEQSLVSEEPEENEISAKVEEESDIDSIKEDVEEKPVEKLAGVRQGMGNPLRTTVKKSASPSPASNGSRKIRNISIQGSLKALKARQNQEQESDEPVIATEFSQEDLNKSWELFVEQFKDQSPSFAHTMAKSNPVIKEKFVIEYTVPNIIIAKDSLNVATLLTFLKNELNNNQLELRPIVQASSNQTEAYTDSARFESLAEKYPEMNKLKNSLDLEIEF
ncbi:MAG: DNA polymerase III subunit gamma/tau [Bacteroidales bacterium]|nr:DNA polymerase III subunit gamma/tau [Bacteroidales bacterium]